MMVTLAELGLSAESPAEIVLTTLSPTGEPHASTIGAKADGESRIKLKVFTDTKTFENIAHRGAAVINITRDAGLLAGLALKEILGFEQESLRFEKSKHVDAPRLLGADAFIEFEVEEMERASVSDEIGISEVAYITGRVKGIEAKRRPARPFKRADFFVIEAAIAATRAIEALKRGRREVAGKFLGELEGYLGACERVAPGSREAGLIAKIADSLRGKLGP